MIKKESGQIRTYGETLYFKKYSLKNAARGIIIIPGLGEYHGDYTKLASNLLRKHQDIEVTIIDLPGHGLSTGARGRLGDYSLILSALKEFIPNKPTYFISGTYSNLLSLELANADTQAFFFQNFLAYRKYYLSTLLKKLGPLNITWRPHKRDPDRVVLRSSLEAYYRQLKGFEKWENKKWNIPTYFFYNENDSLIDFEKTFEWAEKRGNVSRLHSKRFRLILEKSLLDILGGNNGQGIPA